MENYTLHVLVVHFNNPCALKKTLSGLLSADMNEINITVLDNGSNELSYHEAMTYCGNNGFCFLRSEENKGWGGAINYFIGLNEWSETDLLMISAHDANIIKFNQKNVINCFDDPKVAFVCPNYPDPILCEFSLLRSFKCRPLTQSELREDKLKVQVGHATLCLTRPKLIRNIPFDEEYFIYGCESEIFLRCLDAGYINILKAEFTVSNPSTDSNSDFVIQSFTINDIYTSKKRGGALGFVLRLSVVALSVFRLLLMGNTSQSSAKLKAFLWSIRSNGKGFRAFRGL